MIKTLSAATCATGFALMGAEALRAAPNMIVVAVGALLLLVGAFPAEARNGR